MRFVDQEVKLAKDIDYNVLEWLEQVARVCYNSEHLTKEGSARSLIKKLKKAGHMSIFEHYMVSFRIKTDRLTLAQIVRHRTGKYAVRSTRYVDSAENGLEVVKPCDFSAGDMLYWKDKFNTIESMYNELKKTKNQEIARSILPMGVVTEAIVTFDIRNLMHFFDERLSKNASPNIREVAGKMLSLVKGEIDVVFEDYK